MSRSLVTSFLIPFLIYLSTSTEEISHGRVRRYLVFPKGSKFFIRLNIRENIFNYTTIFAQASGFKMTWDLPDHPVELKKKVGKRDIQEGFATLLNRFNIDGKTCIRKFVCEMKEIPTSDIVTQIMLLIFKSGDAEESCGNLDSCPISVLDLRPV